MAVVRKSSIGDGFSYDELKAKAQSALTKTGQSFTWTSIVNVNNPVFTLNATELTNAIDKAYDAVDAGRSANNVIRTHDISFNSSNNST